MFDESDWIVDLTEFHKLAKMLEDAGIPHSNRRHFELGNGRQIILFDNNGKRIADAVCHYGSYGGRQFGLLEILGALTEEESECDSVLGWLTAEEVFKRFKYCYEHNTRVYVEVE